MSDDALAVKVELLNLNIVRDVIMLLAEAMPYVPADSLLVGRIADALVRSDEAALAADKALMSDEKTRRDITWKMARVAHHLVTRTGGYTKAQAAKELARYARELGREFADSVLGDASALR